MIRNKFAVSTETHTQLVTQLDAIKHIVDKGLNGELPFEPDLISKALDDIKRGKFGNIAEQRIVMLISGGSQVCTIKALDGTKTISNSKKDVFKEGVDSFFKSIVKPDKATPETSIELYGLSDKPATAYQVFSSLSHDLSSLCLTQHQISDFCANYPQYIEKGLSFLYTDNNRYYVIGITPYPNLYAGIRYLDDVGRFYKTWSVARFVVPAIYYKSKC